MPSKKEIEMKILIVEDEKRLPALLNEDLKMTVIRSYSVTMVLMDLNVQAAANLI